jgi:geranylgeranyl diphosphate synthase type I
MSECVFSEMERLSKKIDPVLFSALGTGREPRTLYDAASHLLRAGGKRLRPFLVFESCKVVGGQEDNALRIAAAVELFHNFTLVHDDIMDRDDQRRGIPTVHVRFGEPVAITAGDLLFAKVFEVALASGIEKADLIEILKKLAEAAVMVCEGQTLDMMYEDEIEVTEREYIEMVEGKTAALFKAAAQAGAIAGKGTKAEVEHLGSYGFNAGIAFQIIDDVLGLTAESRSLGKPIGSDLREGKKTLIVTHALANSNENQKKMIMRVLRNRNSSPDEIHTAIDVVRSIGSIDYARQVAIRHGLVAKETLSTFKNHDERRLLEALVDFFLERRK